MLQKHLLSLGLLQEQVGAMLHCLDLCIVSFEAVELTQVVNFLSVFLAQLGEVVGFRHGLQLGGGFFGLSQGAGLLHDFLYFLQVLKADDFWIASVNLFEQYGTVLQPAPTNVLAAQFQLLYLVLELFAFGLVHLGLILATNQCLVVLHSLHFHPNWLPVAFGCGVAFNEAPMFLVTGVMLNQIVLSFLLLQFQTFLPFLFLLLPVLLVTAAVLLQLGRIQWLEIQLFAASHQFLSQLLFLLPAQLFQMLLLFLHRKAF